MLGLHMGFRASDVTGLKLSDINWNRQSIRIIQKKTAREIEVPMPVEVGNAIYLYLKYGRHASDSPYVFIKNRVPYNGVQRGTCNYALKKALPDRIGYSYHSVRRTFATERLRNNTGRQAIADLLGHSDTSSLRHYLLHDEEHMRMCPISMAEAGIIPEGGLYD
jgi:integrase